MILYTFRPILGKSASWTQKQDFGHPPRIDQIHFKICGFWTLLGRSWENLLFAPKNLILAILLEFASFTSKFIDSGHFCADPGKICFSDSKAGFWPTTQNQTAPAYCCSAVADQPKALWTKNTRILINGSPRAHFEHLGVEIGSKLDARHDGTMGILK